MDDVTSPASGQGRFGGPGRAPGASATPGQAGVSASGTPDAAEDPTRRRVLADARLVVERLTPDVQSLLRSDDPDVVARRLLRLDVARADALDAEHLDTVVADVVVRRRSFLEAVARLLIAVLGACVVVAVALVVGSFAASAFSRWVQVSHLVWPPDNGIVKLVLLLVGVAWACGYAVVILRGHDRLRRARLACRLATMHQPDTWPGLAIEAPFRRLGRRLTYPGWTLVIAGVVLAAGAALAHRLGFGIAALALVWVGLGVWLISLAAPYRRAQELSERTLFVGRPD